MESKGIMTQETYIIRVQGNMANQYGLGRIVAPKVALFESGFYDLTKEELEAKIKTLRKAVIQ